MKAFAYQEGVPVSEYVRDMVRDHILERGAAFRERGAALRALINAGKAWVIAYHECVAVAASLPDKESLTATWGRGCRPTQPLFNFRLPRLATFALEAEARRVGVSPSAYVRALVIVNLTQRGENASVRRSVLHTNFDRAVKRFTHHPTHTHKTE